MDSSSPDSNSRYIDRAHYDDALAMWPGYERKTLRQYAWVARKSSIRIDDLSFAHHVLVASLPPADQQEWLEAALANGWTVAELRRQLRGRRVNTPDLPEGEFATVVVDPPWDVQAGPGWVPGLESRPLAYSPMAVDEIADIQPPASADAHLYLWTINAYLPDAYEIAEAWGFEPATLLVWSKTPNGLGLGGTFVQTTEYILFARRGVLSHRQRIDRTCFTWKRGAHSVKPEGFFDLVETVSPGPYLEMFARRPRTGWQVWGNEVAA
jgi:N6-adenosine-specific RNA methylase IME4